MGRRGEAAAVRGGPAAGRVRGLCFSPAPLLPVGEAIKFLSLGLNSVREAINPYGAKFSDHVPPQSYSVIPDARQFVLIQL